MRIARFLASSQSPACSNSVFPKAKNLLLSVHRALRRQRLSLSRLRLSFLSSLTWSALCASTFSSLWKRARSCFSLHQRKIQSRWSLFVSTCKPWRRLALEASFLRRLAADSLSLWCTQSAGQARAASSSCKPTVCIVSSWRWTVYLKLTLSQRGQK